MKVTKEKTEDSQVFLTIEVEPAEVEESVEGAYRRLVKKKDVPGFRRGKAPRAILERHIGRESLFEEALNNLIPQAYENAVREQKIETFTRPSIEVTQTDPLIFKAVVPLPPEVVLGDYHHIKITSEPAEVTEDDINTVIEGLRHQQAAWEPVERAVGLSDLVIFDIESTVEDEPFINRKGAQYQVLENQSFPAPGFAEQLMGMGRDEEKEFQLPIPSDYPKDELAGKKASFKVKVSEVKQEKLPELDDEFAKGIDSKFETMDALRKKVTDDLRLRAEEKARLDFEERVIEAMVDRTQVEFPPIMVEMESNEILNQRLRHWRESGKGLEEYLANINKTEEELREELRPLAIKRVTWLLVLEKVAQEEKIEVSDSEIDAEVEDVVKGATEDKKDEIRNSLNTPQPRQSIKTLLTRRKTIQRLVEIAESSGVSIKTPQKEEPK